MSAPDLTRNLRSLLQTSPDAPSLSILLGQVDAFVLHCASSPEAGASLAQLQDDLQYLHHDVVDHAVSFHTEIFLSVLFHLRPLLSSSSLISIWFELALRPALREPRLPALAINHAKELVVAAALDPLEDQEKGKEKVGSFRRRLIDLYLLDAYNESSGEDVLELAELDELQREKKACWKANLEDLLVRIGLRGPGYLLTELHKCFSSPTARLQLLMLLHAFTSQPTFPTQAASTMAHHPIMQSLLYSLVFDNSSTVCTVGITLLTKLLPILAIHAYEDLKRILPWLLLILARIVCWKLRQAKRMLEAPDLLFPPLQLTSDIPLGVDDEPEGVIIDNHNTLPICPDLGWERLELVFTGINATTPPSHQFFSFLYFLFPCNLLRFLRHPVSYLADNGVNSPYTVNWEEALDEGLIRSKTESLLRSHVLHPLLIHQDAAAEMAKPDPWAGYDVPRIVGECTMLDARNASLGLREVDQLQSSQPVQPQHTATTDLSEDSGQDAALSSSADSSGSSMLARLSTAHSTSRPRISLQEMIATSIALKSGLDVEVVDVASLWPGVLSQPPQTRSASRDMATASSRTVTPDVGSRLSHGTKDIPAHVAQALAELQREVLLLRSELNFELWIARENVVHIGRLYEDRVVSKKAEIERQGLHNKMREYKAEVHRLQRELSNHKEQATNMRNQYADWNKNLQDKVRELKNDKASLLEEATAMRAEHKEAKETFVAQGKLLAEATNRVFQLETKIKETAHKVDRLHDYEKQIEQLIKMQKLWEGDVCRLNDQEEYLKVFTSKYRKMELRLETHEETYTQLVDDARRQRQQIQSLQARLAEAQKQLGVRKRSQILDFSQYHERERQLTESNNRLKDDNDELQDEVVELKAMVEMLKVQVTGNRSLSRLGRDDSTESV